MTVWEGSAFDCPTNEITLFHSRFAPQEGPGAYGECNNGVIVARGLRVEGDLYTSQLSVTVSAAITGKSITCVHESVNTRVASSQFSTTVPDLATGRCPELALLISITTMECVYSCRSFATTKQLTH